jgi:hypothetical protein
LDTATYEGWKLWIVLDGEALRTIDAGEEVVRSLLDVGLPWLSSADGPPQIGAGDELEVANMYKS